MKLAHKSRLFMWSCARSPHVQQSKHPLASALHCRHHKRSLQPTKTVHRDACVSLQVWLRPGYPSGLTQGLPNKRLTILASF